MLKLFLLQKNFTTQSTAVEGTKWNAYTDHKKPYSRFVSRPKPLRPQSLTNRKITNFPLPISQAVLEKLITEYTNYCLRKFVDHSVNPSGRYVVVDPNIEQLNGDRWPDSRFDDECFLDTVVMFSLKWSATSESTQDNSKTGHVGASIYEVFLTNVVTRTYNSTRALTGECSCDQHGMASFPCRHIGRCAFTYPELPHHKSQLRNVLGSWGQLEALFCSYWYRMKTKRQGNFHHVLDGR